MKSFLLLYSVFFLFLPPLIAQNETALLNAVKTKLDKVKDYQASGQMKIDVPFIQSSPSQVTVYYKQPDQFRVKKQNGISILPKGGINVTLNSLLLTDQHTIVPAGTATVKGVVTKVIKLLPLNESSDIVLTTLYIDEKNLLIRKTTSTTKENGSYEMQLDYGRYAGWGLPDKVVFLFNTKEYKLPKGVTFEYEKGDKKKEEAVKNKKGKVEINYTTYIINKGIDNKIFQSGK